MIPVILSGGSGSRLWPVSRQSYPKQFCELLDESLFNKTIQRLKPLGSPWVITVKEMKILTERSLKDLGVPLDQSIYEPFGRNTAPAVALVCKRIDLLKRANEVVGIFPADHLIDDESKFQSLVKEGEKLAKEGHVVTLGIQPTYPATGYGYIETSGSFGPRVANALKATGFREKPNEPTAREFLERGGFYWNAGMFIFRASTMIELFKKYAPEIWEVIDSLKSDLSNVDEVYRAVRSTS
ncbi:MAG: mannose-1-phosphate guanylyltransferase, partial [Proteobacteria bacterium]